jgi:4-methyl-5(b-hydroxyethyl)-thiazole monophosphate biosynthesis
MPNVLIPIAPGSEELEAVTLIDILRRAGIDVTVAGLKDEPVKMSRGVVIVPDMELNQALQQDYDLVVLPGGLGGMNSLNADERIHTLIKKMAESGKFTGAICAAPKILADAGLLNGKKVTAYPGFVDTGEYPDLHYTGGVIEQDGTIFTSRGPGTAMDFALFLVETLTNKQKRDEVEKALVRP